MLTINYFPNGEIVIPSSKSITHRVVIFYYLDIIKNIEKYKTFEEIEKIKHPILTVGQISNDILRTQEAILLLIKHFFIKKSESIYVGESGSTLRFLIPIAGYIAKKTGNEIKFEGVKRLFERPLDVYEKLYEEKGIQDAFEKHSEYVLIKDFPDVSHYEITGKISSQFLTGLMLYSVLRETETVISVIDDLESKGYVDLTIEVAEKFGVTISNEDYKEFVVSCSVINCPKKYVVEGDYSNGAFFLAASALGADITVKNLPLKTNQPDSKIIEILTEMEANCILKNDGIRIKASRLRGVNVDVSNIPDLVPILSVLFSVAHGYSKITNAGRLRDKESDRLHAISVELNNLGADILEGEDSLSFRGVGALKGGTARSHNDHRIAMALAVAGIVSEEEIDLEGENAVDKSFPDFWKKFLVKRV